MCIDKATASWYIRLMETNTPDNDLPHDWDLDMQYEDRFACLGDAEIRGDEGDEDWMLQENWPETGYED